MTQAKPMERLNYYNVPLGDKELCDRKRSCLCQLYSDSPNLRFCSKMHSKSSLKVKVLLDYTLNGTKTIFEGVGLLRPTLPE